MKATAETFPSGSVLIVFEPNDRFVYAFPGLPPTANRIWRSGSAESQPAPDWMVHAGRKSRSRTYLEPDYVRWTEQRKADFFMFGAPAAPETGFAVDLVVWAPNRRRFDIDNRIKPALDMLTHAGVWEDDSAVSEVHAVRRPAIVKGGWTVIYVRPARKTPEAVSEIFWLPSEIWKMVIPKEEL